ncbi:MAG: aquaporin Z [Myxococcales bacterium]|nr:aquaporin Z [Myxococcales bacterium]
MGRKLVAELVGTFILVFGGCGSAVFAAAFPKVGIGLVGVSIAFGLTVLGCAYAFGGVSGCHLNPAVSVGLAAAGRFPAKELPGYIIAQVVGAALAAGALLLLLNGQPGGYDASVGGLAANGFGAHSPGKYNMTSALVAEVLLTFIFLTVIIGATSSHAHGALAGVAIGLTLTLVHLVGIPITNLSVNPARSTGPALFVGGWALQQLWLFWVAPIIGAVAAGLLGRYIHAAKADAKA